MDLREEIIQLIKLGKSVKLNNSNNIYLNQDYYNWIAQTRVFLSKIAGEHKELINLNSDFIKLSSVENQTIEIYENLMAILHTVKKFMYMG
jgi:hypothetical protein